MTSHNIFTVKEVTFEQGKNDPFGFGDFTEKLSEKYLPFTGTVRKPTYILFTSYINRLLKEKRIPYSNIREKNEIKIRLEKLLVYCWKSRTNKNLKGYNVIGNSYSIQDIEPFSAKGWIKQNCFKLYTENNFKAEKTLDKYLNSVGYKQAEILKEFLGKEYLREKDKNNYLKDIIKKLGKNKKSLFTDHLLSNNFKKSFKKELKDELFKKNLEYFYHVRHFFDNNKLNPELFRKRTMSNNKLPFDSLNNWFGKIIDAVDADINNRSSIKLWNTADNAYELIDKKYKLPIKIPNKKPIGTKESWFTLENGKYTKVKEFRKYSQQWESYKRRKGEDGTKYFSTFRHLAFTRLLKELEI